MDRSRWVGRRVIELGRGFVDTSLRENKLLPPVLALLALLVFAWVLAGVFLGGTDDQKPVAHRSEIAQANDAGGSAPAAPEIDNPNVDSYAAYRSKDPFRQVLEVSRTIPEGTASTPAEQTTTGSGETNGGRPSNGGNGRAGDSDGVPDGVSGGTVAGGGKNTEGPPGGGGGGRGADGRPGRGGDLLDSGGILSPP